MGYGALSSNTNGNFNIALGYQSGCGITIECNNTIIGSFSAAGCQNTVLIGAGGIERLRIDDTGIYANNVPIIVPSLQLVTDAGSTTTNQVNITNTSTSTDTTTGALVVSGGVAVGGDLNVGGSVTALHPFVLPSYTTSTLATINPLTTGSFVFVTDASGGAQPCYYDGTYWYTVNGRTQIA